MSEKRQEGQVTFKEGDWVEFKDRSWGKIFKLSEGICTYHSCLQAGVSSGKTRSFFSYDTKPENIVRVIDDQKITDELEREYEAYGGFKMIEFHRRSYEQNRNEIRHKREVTWCHDNQT